ncbi:MAG: sulfatase-like hydrolase/transferase [Chloroflexota bacterium]
MSTPKNILFIMCDQLRWDYLSCAGHPHLHTPNIDRLASRGVRFENAFVQSPLCGPSRSCIYTGRYLFSHGSMVNSAPLRVDELTIGDYLGETYLQDLALHTAVVGKVHMMPNHSEMARLGIDPDSNLGQHLWYAGFDPVWLDDGMHPDPITPPDLHYNQWLRSLGYDNENPWDRNANGAVDADGNFLSGWALRNAKYPANIAEEHSCTGSFRRFAIAR